MRYARIEDGTVREIGDFDGIEGRFHPALIWVECPQDVKVGWTFDGTLFSPPPPPGVDVAELIMASGAARTERQQARKQAKAAKLARRGDDLAALKLLNNL